MKENRQNKMEQYLWTHGEATFEELCEHFGISRNTLRRDLNALAARGSIRKQYGGAVLQPSQDMDALSRLAASLVQDHDTIYLGRSESDLHIIRHLTRRRDLRIVSTSLAVLSAAARYPQFTLITPGGVMTPVTGCLAPDNADWLSSYHFHHAFLHTDGVTAAGASARRPEEAKLRRAILERTAQPVLIAPHSVFGKTAAHPFAALSEIGALVTDRPPAPEVFAALAGKRILFPEA